jgi:hypothetical protein
MKSDPELDIVDIVDDFENLGSSKEEARDLRAPLDMVEERPVVPLEVWVSWETWVSLVVKSRALMVLV